MTIDIPDNCECTDDEVCAKCTWDAACAIVELSEAYKKVAKVTYGR